jgi:TetR/AcrR family transcriptional regulator, transcriptional repressor for nem operon
MILYPSYIKAMRYSAQHKTKTHERVLKKAAEQMRRRGVQGTGIASLMGKVGLTHGGFYAHFPNKNALIAEATRPMLEEGVAEVIAAAEAAPEGKKVRAIVNTYLSTQHRDSPQVCPVSGLAGEMARQSETVRNAYIRAFEDRLKLIARFFPGANEQERRDQARLMLSGMAGTLMIARVITSRKASDQFLEQAREFYASAFEATRTQKDKKP